MVFPSCEAEYVDAWYAAWIKMLLEELKIKEHGKMSIDLANYPVCHGRNKHIEMMHHFMRDQVNK